MQELRYGRWTQSRISKSWCLLHAIIGREANYRLYPLRLTLWVKAEPATLLTLLDVFLDCSSLAALLATRFDVTSPRLRIFRPPLYMRIHQRLATNQAGMVTVISDANSTLPAMKGTPLVSIWCLLFAGPPGRAGTDETRGTTANNHNTGQLRVICRPVKNMRFWLESNPGLRAKDLLRFCLQSILGTYSRAHEVGRADAEAAERSLYLTLEHRGLHTYFFA